MNTSSKGRSRSGVPPTLYNEEFFHVHADTALRSARVIVPMLLRLLAPRSVVDIGCGTGAWLRAFGEGGITDTLGVDGNYICRSQLLISPAHFRPMDLSHREPLGRQFDLALCLEVVEHLPSAEGPGFIRYLTDTAPIVLFSAAPPGQGGTHHVNERWPAYWQELFARYRYLRLDPIRPQVWRDPAVAWWYKTNMILYASERVVRDRSELAAEYQLARDNPFELVLCSVLSGATHSPRRILRALPGALWRSLTRQWMSASTPRGRA